MNYDKMNFFFRKFKGQTAIFNFRRNFSIKVFKDNELDKKLLDDALNFT